MFSNIIQISIDYFVKTTKNEVFPDENRYSLDKMRDMLYNVSCKCRDPGES